MPCEADRASTAARMCCEPVVTNKLGVDEKILSLVREFISLHLVAKGIAANTKASSRLRLVSSGRSQGIFYELPLLRFEYRRAVAAGVWARLGLHEILGEIFDIEHGAVRKHARTADDVLEFPYIARPAVALEDNQGARGKAFNVPGEFGAELADKVACE